MAVEFPINQSINQWNNQSINQSINGTINQSINQSINPSIKRRNKIGKKRLHRNRLTMIWPDRALYLPRYTKKCAAANSGPRNPTRSAEYLQRRRISRQNGETPPSSLKVTMFLNRNKEKYFVFNSFDFVPFTRKGRLRLVPPLAFQVNPLYPQTQSP